MADEPCGKCNGTGELSRLWFDDGPGGTGMAKPGKPATCDACGGTGKKKR